MTIIKEKILVGLSGGVDSSTAVLLLQEQGYEVITASILFSPSHQKEVGATENLSRELGTQHHIIDAQSEFEKYVIDDFCNNFLNGCTPNPCIICNPLVKFKTLTRLANALGITKIATGHYAETINVNGYIVLSAAQSSGKDQSYMLYRVPQEILCRVQFPLASYKKTDIRDMAKNKSLSSADKPDSQELCFCDNYIDYLKSRGKEPKTGNFILPDGSTILHKGSYCYTVGQRKGLSVSYKHPLYVKNITKSGDVILCDRPELLQSEVNFSSAVFNPCFTDINITLYCKIRSTGSPVECSVSKTDDETYTAVLTQPVFAPSKGQSIVLYTNINGKLGVVGGGIIT